MLAVLLGVLIASPATAQWRLDVQAGRLQYDAAPDAVTTSLAAGITRSTLTSSFGGSVGIPFTGEEPVWGALQAYKRVASGSRVQLGVDLAANAFGYHLSSRDSSRLLPFPVDTDAESVNGWGGAIEVMPLAGWYGAAVSAEARAGVVGFTTAATGVESIQRTAFVADAWLQPFSWNGLAARVDGRWVSAAEGGFPYAGATLTWSGPASVWGSVGRWFDDAAETVSWRAGAAIPLGSRVALLLNGEHEEIDPVYATPARTTWGAGVRVMLGSAGGVPRPIPASYENGVATIRLEDDDVEGAPSIAGDFNDWTPEPMTRDGAADAWTYRSALEPGVYHYAFVDADGNWFVPEDTPGRRSDGMGGHVAVLVVEGE